MPLTVAILHPGAMGAAVAAAADSQMLWSSTDRSPATAARAAAAGLIDGGNLAAIVQRADVIVSVCPPAAAEEVAADVAELGFDGIYVDANAVSPATARRIAARFARFVDGGIVGGPPVEAGTTRLYLSGDDAPSVAALWKDSILDARVIEGGPGAASALKMAFASWTKGTSALLLAIRGVAHAEGVDEALVEEWGISIEGLAERSTTLPSRVGPKAWRFEGEMHQIADTFEAAGLPGGFHRAAAEVYRRIADLRDLEDPSLADAVDRLLTTDDALLVDGVERLYPTEDPA